MSRDRQKKNCEILKRGVAGRRRFEEHFTVDKMIAVYEEITRDS